MTEFQNARIVAWRNIEDLHIVKNAFFPSPDTLDLRHNALAKVRAWSVRGRIPHSIEATAMLTEAILHDGPGASQLNIQLSYSAAICRFVNGLLDPIQQSQYALPMHILARNLNLPASFVEIRHAATHEALPSLPVLRTAASRALEWLWSNYWAWIGTSPDEEATVNDEELQERLLSQARLLLKQWRRLRRENPTKTLKYGDASPENKEALGILKECIGMCAMPEGLEVLLDALLEEKGLIPSGKKKSSTLMKGAFLLWTPFLEALDASIPTFSQQLFSAMLDVFHSPAYKVALSHLTSTSSVPLLATPSEATPTTELNRSILSWLKYLTSNNSELRFGKGILINNKSGDLLDIEDVAKQCVLNPSEWTLDLLKHLLKNHGSLLEMRYTPIVPMMELQIAMSEEVLSATTAPRKQKSKSSNTEKGHSLQQIQSGLATFEARLHSLEKQIEEGQDITGGENWGNNIDKPDREFDDGSNRMDIDEHDGHTVNGGNDVRATDTSAYDGKWKRYEGTWTSRPIGVV